MTNESTEDRAPNQQPAAVQGFTRGIVIYDQRGDVDEYLTYGYLTD